MWLNTAQILISSHVCFKANMQIRSCVWRTWEEQIPATVWKAKGCEVVLIKHTHYMPLQTVCAHLLFVLFLRILDFSDMKVYT